MDEHVWSGFSDVDHAKDRRDLVRLLDRLGVTPFFREYKRHAWELLDLRPGDAVLDAGCGTGEDTRALARLVAPGGRAAGLDASETMVAEARRRHVTESAALADAESPVEFVRGDLHALPFGDATFDACLTDRTFQHVAEPRQALAELVRVTKPGGRLVVVDPDHGTTVVEAENWPLMRRFLNWRADTIRNGWIAHHMPALFQEAGLTDVTVTPLTRIVTDPSEAEDTMHLEGGIGVAAERGALTAAEADELVAELRRAAEARRFLLAVTFFLTSGRKAS